MISNNFEMELEYLQNPFGSDSILNQEDNLLPHWLAAQNLNAEQIQSNDDLNLCKLSLAQNQENPNKVQNKSNTESSFEISTKFPAKCTNGEFLKYLDMNFKPEINLAEDDNNQNLSFKSAENPKKEDLDIGEINLIYRGQKNMFESGKNAHRYDVLYKTFIRAVRRYLWMLFEKEFDTSSLRNKASQLYREYVIKFYDKYFKQYSSNQITEESSSSNIYFILGLLQSNKYSFPNKNNTQKKLSVLFYSICRSFSRIQYQKFFLSDNVSDMFQIYLKSGFIEKMIDVYPKLSESKDLYLAIALNIANFESDKF